MTNVFPVGDILAAFSSLPMHERVTAAAQVVRDLNLSEGWLDKEGWNHYRLDAVASRLRVEAEINDLAEILHQAREGMSGAGGIDRRDARAILDAGYRKAGA